MLTSRCSYVEQMPKEMWLAIFVALLEAWVNGDRTWGAQTPHKQPGYIITQVCRLWRQLGRCEPKLWKDISILLAKSTPQHLEDIFGLAGKLSVTLEIAYFKDVTRIFAREPLVVELRSCLRRRCLSFKLCMLDREEMSFTPLILKDIIEKNRRIRRLESLSFDYCVGERFEITRANLPKLRQLEIIGSKLWHGITWLRPRIRTSKLKSFTLKETTCFESALFLKDVARSSSHLTVISLQWRTVEVTSAEASNSALQREYCFPALIKMALRLPKDGPGHKLLRFIDRIEAPNLQHLTLTTPHIRQMSHLARRSRAWPRLRVLTLCESRFTHDNLGELLSSTSELSVLQVEHPAVSDAGLWIVSLLLSGICPQLDTLSVKGCSIPLLKLHELVTIRCMINSAARLTNLLLIDGHITGILRSEQANYVHTLDSLVELLNTCRMNSLTAVLCLEGTQGAGVRTKADSGDVYKS